MADNPPSHDPIDCRIGRIAARQHNNVTRAQLLKAGLGVEAIVYRARVGRLYREYPGVYGVGKPATTALEKASAAVLACYPAALSDGSALTHWGVWRRWDRPFEVTLLGGDRRPEGIKVHRRPTLRWADTTVHHGIRVTKLARAVLDMAPRLTDEQLWTTVDNALHTPYMTRGQLHEQLILNPRHRAAKRLLKFVTTKDGPTRADWERAFPGFCARYGLPRPILSQRSGPHTVDAMFEEEQLLVELDSWEYHSSRRAFENDRDRDADNLELERPTLRITWDRLHNAPDREAARLHRILRNLRGHRRAA
jgi:hypothetical protein